MPATTIDMLRHGQPLGGAVLRGQQDDPLSEAGWQDMRRCLGERTAWSAVVSSPLLRCADFARDHARRIGLAVELEPRFREIHFGSWEGRERSELLATDGVRLQAYWDDPASNPPPDGETLAAFRERVLAGWDDLLNEHRAGHVLVVTHAGVIRVVLAQLLSVPATAHYRIDVPNARVTRIRIDGDRGRKMARLLFHGACLDCA